MDEKNKIDSTKELTTRAAMKESIMDYAGHFSTASAILAGFYMATAAFVISVRAENAFPFLEEPLLAEITFLGDLLSRILVMLNLSAFWPSHFEYMLLIFISLFLCSIVSYACFLRVGMIQVTSYKTDETSEEKVIFWLQRGMSSLLISLIFSFITIPWALLRFVTDQALILAILLLVLVIISLFVAFKGWNFLKKII